MQTMWATKYIAIDFSSKNIAIAFTSIDDKKLGIDYHYIKTNKKDFYERLLYLFKEFEYFLDNANVYCALIEQPAIALRHKSVRMVNQVSGMLLTLMIKYNIKFKEVHNKTWKKVVVGNGNAKKEDISNYVIKKYKIKKKISQDICDAVCIYEYGNKVGWKI